MVKHQKDIKALITQDERAMELKPTTPSQFTALTNRIFAITHVRLSATTLMRLWGYINEDVSPRETTLDALASVAGYTSWRLFVERWHLPQQPQSNPVMGDSLNVTTDLTRGDLLRLTWSPKRAMLIEYEGNGIFRVIHAEGTRLKRDTTFMCHLFIQGEPLFVSNVLLNGRMVGVYVCGKDTGIHYEHVTPA